VSTIAVTDGNAVAPIDSVGCVQPEVPSKGGVTDQPSTDPRKSSTHAARATVSVNDPGDPTAT
jgi:hypothetical protein